MSSRIILGRITENTQELVNRAVKCCQADDILGNIYFDIRNDSVESFISDLSNTTRVVGSGYWEIKNIKAFIEEVESKMPVIVEGMDELDFLYAEQVLRFLPMTLEHIKRDVLLDQQHSRISRYYFKTVGNVVKGNLDIQLSSATHAETIQVLTSSAFYDPATRTIKDMDKYINDLECRLHVTTDPVVIQELTDVYNTLKANHTQYTKVVITILN